jgi:CHAT domain-containing protein
LASRHYQAELGNEVIATLVFVPDEKLRLLPIAALYDGEKYLVEQYAIAVVPGLTLTFDDNSEKSNDSKIQPMLFAGISVSESELETQNEIEGIRKTEKNGVRVKLIC